MAASRALDLRLQELVYAGLEALAAVDAADVCAYLHDSPATGPQLFLGQPSLAEAKGPQAYSIFADLSTLLERSHGVDGVPAPGIELVGGVRCLTVWTVGPESRGVHAIGRRSGESTGPQRAALGRLASALATSVHQLQWAAEGSTAGLAS